jgi:hypothetical protein
MKKIGKDTIKKKAWRTFSKWIRNRDKNCVTCKTGLAENAGHFWHGVLDFDEENINGQCVRCNKWLSGNLAPYSVYLLKKLGKKKFDALDIRHTRAIGGEYRTDQEYNAIIEKYKL